MYSCNTAALRLKLWDQLREISHGTQLSWMISGDFNALLHPKDRYAGNPVQHSELKDFAQCLQDYALYEMS